ncbi:histidine phosphatase family protein [Massilia sp. IC2-477]|uniref:histidine phosphatase family protein n=1 Tax=Massilia sp. IC2-477 TaxID=2887198 RepID=UPI001D110FA0|nr:histidine phosphatase family protein [Massilia sp. IC2-477]MCC2958099.1 histidine phosphatase family protein [Massilia sp. IC2-477]
MPLNDNAVTPTTILLIRHGETAWNAEKRLQGHLDIPLNAEGERQAALLGAALAAEPVDHIVSSDLMRARQTAEAIAHTRGARVATDPALRERCYGGFEGLLYSEIAARFPLEFAAWQARDVDGVLPPGTNQGESFRQFYERAVGAILAHAQAHPGKTIALVAHGGVLECAYRAALGLSLETPRDFKVLNASVNRFVVEEGGLKLVSWGEVGHLRPAVLDDLT